MPPTKKSPSKSKKTAAAPKPIEAIRHRDKRANIPTQELRDFVREEEAAPGSVL